MYGFGFEIGSWSPLERISAILLRILADCPLKNFAKVSSPMT
jgi:hypothetical protein